VLYFFPFLVKRGWDGADTSAAQVCFEDTGISSEMLPAKVVIFSF
jgi:hypothetical protein